MIARNERAILGLIPLSMRRLAKQARNIVRGLLHQGGSQSGMSTDS